jgi:ribosome modulation factor
MSLKNLGNLTRTLTLTDTDKVFKLGAACYMGGFEKTACRFQNDRDRTIWLRGYDMAREKFLTMIQRWRALDRGTL